VTSFNIAINGRVSAINLSRPSRGAPLSIKALFAAAALILRSADFSRWWVVGGGVRLVDCGLASIGIAACAQNLAVDFVIIQYS